MVKEQKQKLFFWVIIGLALAILIGNRNFWGLIRAYRERARLQQSQKKLDTENQFIRQQIYTYEHDDAAIERIAREELGLTKEGEIEYRFKKAAKK
jgi:cell division protein FtsB